MTRNRRIGINWILTAVIAVFLCSLFFSVKNLAELYRVDRDEYGHVIWIATQLERDYLKFMEAVESRAIDATPATRRELERRIGALHSRLQLFREGSQGALLTKVPEIEETVAKFRGRLIELEPALVALADGDLTGAPALIEELRAAERPIHRAVIAAFHEDNAFARTLNKGFEQFALISAGSLLGILISGAALIVLSVLQARRAELAEQQSAQARHEAERDRAKAESASRAKSDFLAQMSHELRTPLNAILGFSEVVKRQLYGPVGDKRYTDYAGYIHSSGNHLLSLIDDILDLSRVESGRYELDVELVDLAELVANEVSFFADYAESNQVRLGADLSADTVALLVDRRALRQILLNLLSNAVKYTPAGGEVTIGSHVAANGGLALTVSDSGDGIAPEDVAKALEPFGRLQGPLTQSREGCGLGLSITKRLVELHDGRLEIAGRPGGGTTVTVTLPAERSRWAANAA